MITCEHCSREVASAWITTQDSLACERCLKDCADCPHCLRVILPGDGVVDYERDCCCFECAEGHPPCRECQAPLFGKSLDYCDRCLATLRFCHRCGGECSKRFFQDGADVSCPSCCRCWSCGAEGLDIVEYCCPGCQRRPRDLREALELYPAAYEFLHQVMGLELHEIPRLQASVEQPEVEVRSYPKALKAGGGAVGMYNSSGWIWVKCGRSEQHSLCTLVHELGHAWQNENCPFRWQADDLIEGFARWLQYNCALYLNYPELADEYRTYECPVYGGGLRLMLAWEEAVGQRQMLEELRLAIDFPDWIRRGWFRGGLGSLPKSVEDPPLPAQRPLDLSIQPRRQLKDRVA